MQVWRGKYWFGVGVKTAGAFAKAGAKRSILGSEWVKLAHQTGSKTGLKRVRNGSETGPKRVKNGSKTISARFRPVLDPFSTRFGAASKPTSFSKPTRNKPKKNTTAFLDTTWRGRLGDVSSTFATARSSKLLCVELHIARARTDWILGFHPQRSECSRVPRRSV